MVRFVNIIDKPLEGLAVEFFSEILLLRNIANRSIFRFEKLLSRVDVVDFVLVEPNFGQAISVLPHFIVRFVVLKPEQT